MTDPLDLATRLEQAIVRLREDDTFLPVHVLVASPLLGTWLSRTVFAGTGHVALYFERPEDLAWRIAERRALSERARPASDFADLAMILAGIRTVEENVEEKAEENAGDTPEPEDDALADYLRVALRTRGFAPAALRTLHDLDVAGIDAAALDALAPSSPAPERLELLARLQRTREQRLERARLLSQASLWRRASQALAETQPPELGAVVACHLGAPPPVLGAFLQALAQRIPFVWLERPARPATAPRHTARSLAFQEELSAEAIPGASPQTEEEPKTALRRLQAQLFTPQAGQAASALDPTLRILAAPGEPLEAVEIARLIARSDIPWGETAVLLRGGATQAASLDAAFARAGIPALFFEGTPRVDAAARSLSLLLDLLERDFERARVMEFVTTAQVPWQQVLGPDVRHSVVRWDLLSARAGIVAGLSQWRSGLDRAEQKARETAEYYEQNPDDARDVRLLGSLRTVIESLASDFAAFPRKAGWGTFFASTLALLDLWVRRGDTVRARLESVLMPLAVHAPPPTRAEFIARVQELLASQAPREGELGEARVFVGSIANAAGLRFRQVFVPGLAERRFPSAVRPDPLLLDDERLALSAQLHTTEDAQEGERRLFEEAVSAATERLVLSYPRVEAGGRETVPSTFLLRAAEAATGQRVTGAGLLQLAEAGETLLGRAWPLDPGQSLDVLERDLSLVASGHAGAARHLLEDAPHMARARNAERAGWERRLTAWDGVVDTSDPNGPDMSAWLDRLRPGPRASASRLEGFAACAYRHFLNTGLRVRAWEEPARVYQPDALQRGSLYHEALERIFLELKTRGALPLTPDRLTEAQSVAHIEIAAVLDAAATNGAIVHRALLGPLEIEMRRDIGETLRLESEADGGYVPAEFEAKFENVHFAYGDDGREIVFRGIFDRVDLAEAPARVRIIDWKTGGYRYEEGQEFDGGRAFQLVLYNLGAAQLYPEREVTEASYRFSTEKGRFQDKECPNSKEKLDTLGEILTRLDRMATSGVFAPSADSCTFCDFAGTICGEDTVREARAARKADDPRLEGFRILRRIP